MFARKIMVLTLGFFMSFVSMTAMSATETHKKSVTKTKVEKVKKNQKVNTVKNVPGNSAPTLRKDVDKKNQGKVAPVKGNKPSNKANNTSKKTVEQAVKKEKKLANVSTHKKSAKKANNAKNETKKHYGVKGAKLVPTKIMDKKYSYREKGKTHTTISKEASRLYSQTGVASYYGGMFHGRKTANGEIFNKNAYTAAHKTLALGSYALVTNLRNGRKVIVRINDRGPFSKSRIIDLSVASAKEIGMIHSGVARVKVEAMQVDRNGYISGKGAESLLKLAKKSGLHLKVKGDGKNLAIKAE